MKNHLRRRVAVTVLVTSLLSACFLSPPPTNKPDVNDLSGVWIPDKATLEDMAERGGYDTTRQTKLILHADGKLELVNMPDWLEKSDGESRHGLHSYTGSWEVTKSEKDWLLAISYSKKGTFFSIYGNKPPYKTGTYLGDPDSGNMMIFVKQ